MVGSLVSMIHLVQTRPFVERAWPAGGVRSAACRARVDEIDDVSMPCRVSYAMSSIRTNWNTGCGDVAPVLEDPLRPVDRSWVTASRCQRRSAEPGRTVGGHQLGAVCLPSGRHVLGDLHEVAGDGRLVAGGEVEVVVLATACRRRTRRARRRRSHVVRAVRDTGRRCDWAGSFRTSRRPRARPDARTPAPRGCSRGCAGPCPRSAWSRR